MAHKRILSRCSYTRRAFQMLEGTLGSLRPTREKR